MKMRKDIGILQINDLDTFAIVNSKTKEVVKYGGKKMYFRTLGGAKQLISKVKDYYKYEFPVEILQLKQSYKGRSRYKKDEGFTTN